MTKATQEPTQFEFLNPLDGKTYTLPPYDAEKWSDEIAAHPDFVPKVSLTDALLADDPKVGLDSLNKPLEAMNVLVKRSIVKTLRNHLEGDDPAWLALKELIDTGEFEVLAKVFTEWQAASGEGLSDPAGEG
jgi:hypothetical protein